MGERQTESYYTHRHTLGGKRHLRARATSVLSNGAWLGKRCFIIGGGPSLRCTDLSGLEGENVIGINMGYRFPATTVALVCSINLLNRLRREHDWLNWTGTKLTLESFIWNGATNYGCNVLSVAPRECTWGPSLEVGFPIPGNAGPLAINLAAVLGASPIYLLGFDMRGEGGQTANYHSYYRVKLPESRYELYAKEIEERCAGRANIVNLTPDSALTCFPTAELRDVI